MFIVNPLSGSSMMNLFSTHTPLEQRIARLRGAEKRLRNSGNIFPNKFRLVDNHCKHFRGVCFKCGGHLSEYAAYKYRMLVFLLFPYMF